MAVSGSQQVTSPIVVALDFDNSRQALELADKLDPHQCRLKIGKELFTRAGSSLVNCLQQQQFDIFLDLKFHDIPNTVAKAVASAADLGVWMVNVHASGGIRMMQAARHALQPFADDAPKLIAVTVLTSMDDQDLQDIGIQVSAADYANRLAQLTQQCELDGVVCSAREAAQFRQQFGPHFTLLTPGIRPEGSATDDQRRVMTPLQAQQAGVDYMVIGRPITQSADPANTLASIISTLRSA